MKYKRNKKLIEPKLQLKCALAFACLAGLATIVQSLVLNFALFDLAARLPGESRTLVASQIPAVLADSTLLTIAFLLPVAVLTGIAFSFKVAGPLFAIKRYLGQVIAGEQPGECRIRQGDELQELCDLVNQSTAPLRVPRVTSDSHAAQEPAPRRAA
jgi:hypothetical protein